MMENINLIHDETVHRLNHDSKTTPTGCISEILPKECTKKTSPVFQIRIQSSDDKDDEEMVASDDETKTLSTPTGCTTHTLPKECTKKPSSVFRTQSSNDKVDEEMVAKINKPKGCYVKMIKITNDKLVIKPVKFSDDPFDLSFQVPSTSPTPSITSDFQNEFTKTIGNEKCKNFTYGRDRPGILSCIHVL